MTKVSRAVLPQSAPEGTADGRLSLRKFSLWVTVLTAVGMAVGLLLVVIVSDSVIRLAEQGGDVSARQRMEELRAIGNLERLIALGDQLVEEREGARARTLANTMQALAMQPAAGGREVNPAVADTFEVVRELQAIREAQRVGTTAGGLGETEHARVREVWNAHRNRLKAVADDTAVGLVQTVTESSRAIVQGSRLVLTVAVVGTLLAGIIGLLLVVTVRRQLLGPLMAISDYLVGLRKGVDAGLALPVARSREVADVVDAVSQLATAQHALERAALHDPLTGLSNRYGLEARMEQAMHHARRMGLKLAVMFIDLDRFKAINDSLGHVNGDQLLRIMADRFSGCLRDTDMVARLGGDEFVVVMTDLVRASDAVNVAEKLLDSAQRPLRLEGIEMQVTASLGVCFFPDDGKDAVTLMKHADIAMYQAKSAGRSNFKFFSPEMNSAVAHRLGLESELRRALDRNEFELFYQPQISASSGRLEAAEALIRWRREDGTLVSPIEFIPIAEESALVSRIGEWVLCEACAQLAAWRARGAQTLRISVNLSVRQLRDPALAPFVAALLQKHALPPAALELEITESAAMEDPEASIRNLGALRALGVSLAIDDFGTGYSSLAYLKLLPIDRLKLDRSFVSELEIDPDDATICAATVGLAHNLRMELIAEGVETAAQADYLRELGCDLLQGYYFHKPLSLAAFSQLLEQSRVVPGLAA